MEIVPGLSEDANEFVESATLENKNEKAEEHENICNIHCDVGAAIRNNSLDKVPYEKDLVFW